MIKRTTKHHIKQILEEKKKTWRILDLACGPKSDWAVADTFYDREDFSATYKRRKFFQGDASRTPFADKEFDFVISSHIAEHVESPELFMCELMRIAKRGYIEVPTPFCDNIMIGNRAHHPWWVSFDDIEQKLVYLPKIEILKESIWHREYNMFLPFFRSSFVTELYWEDNIPWKMGEKVFHHRNREIDLRDDNIEIKQWMLGEVSAADLILLSAKKKL